VATHTSIADVGETLKKILQDGLNETFGNNEIAVTLDSPKKIEEDSQTRNKLLSIFLYKVLENPDLKNQPFRAPNLNDFQPPPLTLDLCYMITAYGTDETIKSRILGRAMQIMYDHPLLQGADLTGGLEGTAGQIKVSLNPLSQELIVQVWQALEASMRVSVFYLATPAVIDSTRKISTARVRERNLE